MASSQPHKHNFLPIGRPGRLGVGTNCYACYGCNLVIEWDRYLGEWLKLRRHPEGYWEYVNDAKNTAQEEMKTKWRHPLDIDDDYANRPQEGKK